ncbi:hypothetical protein LDHU3_01.0920:CDS1 [Leishmania donovani]|nr:hypothetical protein LDHU3_01.0920:CDS1 [Leishmania donovani]
MVCPFTIAIRVGLVLFVAKTLYDAVCTYQQNTASKCVKGNGDGDKQKPSNASSRTAATAV